LLKVVVTGGGTGGHIYPALAVAEELSRRVPCKFLFIGTRRGLEASMVPARGMAFKTVWISGLKRMRLLENLTFPLKMAVSLFQSLGILLRFKPDLAVGTGGYVSWPVITSASLLGAYTVVQEQNEKPGLVTRLLARRADAVHLSFSSSVRFFRKKSNLHVSGNPTRADLERPRDEAAYLHFGLKPDVPTLFVFGGSQGSGSLNQAMVSLAPALKKDTNAQILWATGEKRFEDVRKQVPEGDHRIRLFPYIHDMNIAYSVSDLIVCRSGAGTVAEIARLGLPAVFVPFPNAAGAHQEANAKVLTEAGAAVFAMDGEGLDVRLKPVLVDLLANPEKRAALSRRVRSFAKPDAAEAIVNQILENV
jgi:UDP-N-acetylglucosamine--N-acetylmuramyl-(pentapeptide) pyrophosphoryl-undecaprenol N-acetylglucosamine transferase